MRFRNIIYGIFNWKYIIKAECCDSCCTYYNGLERHIIKILVVLGRLALVRIRPRKFSWILDSRENSSKFSVVREGRPYSRPLRDFFHGTPAQPPPPVPSLSVLAAVAAPLLSPLSSFITSRFDTLKWCSNGASDRSQIVLHLRIASFDLNKDEKRMLINNLQERNHYSCAHFYWGNLHLLALLYGEKL